MKELRQSARRAATWPAAVGVAGLVASAIVLNQSAIHWRVNVADSDLFAYYGWCVGQGARPYVDIWDNKPPGIWWANAAAISVCGPGAAADMLLGTAALLLTCAAFLSVVVTVYGGRLLVPGALAGAVILTQPLYECGANRTETLLVTCELLALLGYVRWRRTRRNAWLLAVGLAAGVAPLCKQAGIAAVAAMLVHQGWLWRHQGQRPAIAAAIFFAIGAACAPVLAGTSLLAAGALGEALYATGRFNQAYFAVGDASWLRIDRALANYWPLLTPLASLLALAVVGIAVSAWRAVRRRPERVEVAAPVLLWTAWLLIALYLACVGPGRMGYHLMPILPPLAFLVVHALAAVTGGAALGPAVARRAGLTVVLVLWVLVLAGAASRNWRGAAAIWPTKPTWYALDLRTPSPAQAQGAAVTARTRPDALIYVWGWSPGTYRYACRWPASRFATIEKSGQIGQFARPLVAQAQADVQRVRPAVLVVSVTDLDGLRAADTGFAQWVLANYRETDTIAGNVLLVPRDGLPSRAAGKPVPATGQTPPAGIKCVERRIVPGAGDAPRTCHRDHACRQTAIGPSRSSRARSTRSPTATSTSSAAPHASSTS